MVKWTVETQAFPGSGIFYSGYSNDGSWRELKDTVATYGGKIVGITLDNEGKGSATIDSNKDGYFLGNKVVAAINGGQQVELVGIGYWDKNQDTARIKWYNVETMELVFTEARSTKECGFFLIKNQ